MSYNGYTITTDYERISDRAQQLRAELIEALGDYDKYIAWANQLSVSDHLDRVAFVKQAELKLAEIAAIPYADLTGAQINPELFAGECEEELPPLSVTEDGPEYYKTNGVY